MIVRWLNNIKTKKITWDGKEFVVWEETGAITSFVCLNPREMLNLIKFAGRLGKEED